MARGTAVSLVCAAAMLVGNVALDTAGAFAAGSAADDPVLTLTPAAGPPGTHVVISGSLTPAQIPVWTPMFANPDIFDLVADLPNGCELQVDVTNATIHLNTATGAVTGSFIAGSGGSCFQSQPDAAQHPPPPGRYHVAIGCCQASEVAAFTLTAPSAAPTLPATGFPVGIATMCASTLIFVGIVMRRRSHRA